MKATFFLSTIASMMTSVASAGFDLSQNGKKVVCYADDNQSWELNKARTTIKYTIEGETMGALKIFDRDSDNTTFASYSTAEGTLTLSNNGDTYQFAEADEISFVSCR